MNRILTTESGSVYETRGGGYEIRRVNDAPGAAKRADGDWVKLRFPLPSRSLVGECAHLVLESLAPYGPDDNGIQNRGAEVTMRHTTRVVTDTFGED